MISAVKQSTRAETSTRSTLSTHRRISSYPLEFPFPCCYLLLDSTLGHRKHIQRGLLPQSQWRTWMVQIMSGPACLSLHSPPRLAVLAQCFEKPITLRRCPTQHILRGRPDPTPSSIFVLSGRIVDMSNSTYSWSWCRPF